MDAPLTRRSFVRAALGAAAAIAAAPGAALATRLRAPHLRRLTVANPGRRYAGDRSLLATVSPGVPGRDTAALSFGLDRPATVRLEAVRTALRRRTVVWSTEVALPAGEHELAWTPEQTTPVGTYVMRLDVRGEEGLRRVYGGRRPSAVERVQAPVVRVLGLEAAFDRRSYLPGEPMRLTVFADVPRFTLTFLRCGFEPEGTLRNDELSGVPLGEPVAVDWTGKRSAPWTAEIVSGPWSTGLYAVRLAAEDGRVGFAPFILRAPEQSGQRQAIVLPTNTWQAYNFDDSDGDGWGDTWYAGGSPPVDLGRPYRDRGVPPRYRRYDLPFLIWLRRTRHAPDVLADDDLEAFASGDELRRLYDLVVFPGHSEYMTEQAYDVVERFRDLGGRLVFLSANNFFWRVDKQGNTMRRVKLWRQLGRPEARLLGVQYRANDDGSRRQPFTVVDAGAAPWLFAQTGLDTGSLLGDVVGGYGIEIDATTPDSPPGTAVLARIPDLYGPGVSAEMAYYETPAGARVFSAGAMDFCSSALTWPVSRLLDNLWRHMLTDVPPPPPPDAPAPPAS
jgi:hypothetical protein